jgi:hypothetical protein
MRSRESAKRKTRPSFLKKEAKNFYKLARAGGETTAWIQKSFLVLFFKKEPLTCLSFPFEMISF